MSTHGLPAWITESVEETLVAAMRERLDHCETPDFDEALWCDWLWCHPDAPEDGVHTPELSAWFADLWNDVLDELDADSREALWGRDHDDNDAAYDRCRDMQAEEGY